MDYYRRAARKFLPLPRRTGLATHVRAAFLPWEPALGAVMNETKAYKISYETLITAMFAIRVRIERIEMMSEESRAEDYWKEEHRRAVAALAELRAL